MTNRKLVLRHWPNIVAFRYPGHDFVISLDPDIDALSWEIYDIYEPDEDAAWAKAAEYTHGRFLLTTNLLEEIAKCEELRHKSNEDGREIFTRIIERLRSALAKASEDMPTPAPSSFDRMYDLAVKVLGDESKAALWLSQRIDRPGGRSALQMLQTEEGARAVKEMLVAIESGTMMRLPEVRD